ncbi:MAG: hypothetical protein LBD45_09805 [Bacteroidales bacterium]|jgi:hypothetical protein|nr:hypothetical protein [Bacteroidales bacterium]
MKQKLLLALLAVAVAVGQTTAQQTGDIVTIGEKRYQLSGTNLIPNPGFEEGFTGWTSGANAEITSDNFTLSAGDGVDGSTCLYSVANLGIGTAGSIGTGWAIEQGKTYYFSFCVKHQDAGAAENLNAQYLKISLTNDKANTTETTALVLNGGKVGANGEWTKNEAVFVNSSNYGFVVARFRWLGTAYAFDNFTLFEAAELPNPDALQAVIDEAQGIYTAGANGAAELLAAITAAQTKLSTTSIPEMEQAIVDLKAAIQTYRLANASPSLPYDATGRIANPSFESNFDGWTNNGMATQTNSWSNSMKDGNVYVEKWVSDTEGNNVPDVGIQQTVTGLPNGSYTLTVTAQNLRQSTGAQFGGYIYASATEAEVGDLGDYSLDFVVVDGTVTIGFKTVSSTANWVACDNFRLFYKGVDLAALKTALSTRVDYGNTLAGSKMQQTVATELSAAITEATGVVMSGSATESIITEAALRLNNAIAAAELSIAAYTALQDAIASANTNKTAYATWDGYAAFDAAINTAQGVYNAATEDAAGIEAAIQTLKNAEYACLWTQPTPFDATFVIVNPSFDDNTSEGWTNPSTVSWNEMEFWQKDVDVYQTLSGLPAGKYTLQIQGFERPKANDSGQDYINETETLASSLYATGSLGEYSTPLNSLYSVEYYGSVGALNGYANSMEAANIMFADGSYDLTLNDIVVGGDGQLTIGVKSVYTSGASGQWILFDNFRLTFVGPDLEAIKAALQQQINTAKTYQGQKMQQAVNTALNTTIANAETAIANLSATANELSAAAVQLNAAIVAATPSIAAYASLNDAIADAVASKTEYDYLPGAAVFQAAIDASNGIYTAGDANEAAVAEAIKTLRQANVTFRLTADTPCDATVAVANPDFEEAYAEFTKPSADRAIHQPSGWTAEWQGDGNDMTYVAATYTQDAVDWTSYEGNSYFTRQRWSGNGSFIGLSQETAQLPAGQYQLKFQAAAFGTSGDASGNAKGYVTAGGVSQEAAVTVNTADPATWAEYTVDFTVNTVQPVTIGIRSTKLADNFKAAYDHFTLYLIQKLADGIGSVSADDPVVYTEYYNLQGQKVMQPLDKGFYLVKKTHESKNVSVEKIIYRIK